MIDTTNRMERFLQRYRFRKALPYIKGDVMDFGGNEGELRQFVTGEYLPVNYDHSVMAGKMFDTIMALAVVEHIEPAVVYEIFGKFKKDHLRPNGRIFLTTPTPLAKPVLEAMAATGILQKHNIEEHKHYWSKKDLYDLAEKCGFEVEKYAKFQGGVNQYAVFRHARSGAIRTDAGAQK